MAPSDESFAARWSRRKVRARDGDVPDETSQTAPKPGRMITAAPIDVAEDGTEAASALATKRNPPPTNDDPCADGEAAEPAGNRVVDDVDFDNFDFDSLDHNSDYTRFMADNVPENIRNKALRKLWQSAAGIGQIDGLDDYAEDFSDAIWVVDNLQTSYKVGKGFASDDDLESAGAAAGPDRQRITRDRAAIAVESHDQPEIAALLAESDRYYQSLYPHLFHRLADTAALNVPNARFMVARVEGKAVGCGALLLGAGQSAELKRMWVTPEMRGSGLGRKILQALEAAARDNHVGIVRLESGVRQPDALALYRSAGYLDCEPFGSYKANPQSIFMKKCLEEKNDGGA